MEDVLYILIGVAWVAYSIYSYNQKAKKNKQTKQSHPYSEYESNQSDQLEEEEEYQEQPSAFDELISEFKSKEAHGDVISPLDYQKSPVPEPLVSSEESIHTEEEPMEDNSPLSQEMYEQYKETEEEFVDKDDINELSDSEDETGEEIDFDLKKAIIYSEILKRPEY